MAEAHGLPIAKGEAIRGAATVSRPVAVLGYGSLVWAPGVLSRYIVDHLPAWTPFPVEYARSSKGWGGGPTLVPSEVGGPVTARLLVLSLTDVEQASELLRRREGNPQAEAIRRSQELEDVHMDSLNAVIYAHLQCNIHPVAATRLAELAMSSFSNRPEEDVRAKNGVLYLRMNIAHDIITPATSGYVAELLRRCRASTLAEAEAACRQRALEAQHLDEQ